MEVTDPSTSTRVYDIPACDESDVNLAVAAARKAFDEGVWSDLTGHERASYLRRIANGIRECSDRLSVIESVDCGKPLKESLWDIDDAASCFDYYADMAEKLDRRQGETVEMPDPDFRTALRREPVGVAALITPWNYPLLMAVWKVAPALAAGCTVILKPSELASLTCLELAVIAEKAELPKGVFNIVTGYGVDTGAPLSAHPNVDKVAFTGSVPTGKKVMMAAAERIKNVSLELGGKSAFLIFDDVDVDDAVEWIMFGAFWTNGQICSATSRVLLHSAIAEKVLAKLKEETEKIKPAVAVGDVDMRAAAEGGEIKQWPQCEEEGVSTIGPIVSAAQLAKIEGYIQSGKEEGATLLTGGGRPHHILTSTAEEREKVEGGGGGYFLSPTVFANVEPNMKIWREEIFGPVLSIKTFDTEEEAVALANDSDFGLAAAVMTKDEDRMQNVAKKLRSGIVWLNCSQPCFVQAPWGGMKQSGLGRELGPFGLDNYLEVKQITRYATGQPWGWYQKKPNSKL